MTSSSEVVLLWAYTILLVSVALALPWTGRLVQMLRDTENLGPGSGGDARAVHVGSSALLFIAAAGIVILLALR